MNLHTGLVSICCLLDSLPLNTTLHCVSQCKLFVCKTKIDDLQRNQNWCFLSCDGCTWKLILEDTV